jgi:hypothetical protein
MTLIGECMTYHKAYPYEGHNEHEYKDMGLKITLHTAPGISTNSKL